MRRFLPDTFTLLIAATVGVAAVLPAHGRFADIFAVATDLAIALLFFLHGARLAPSTVRAGILHWRLQLLILAVTFGFFPVIGLGLGLLPEAVLPHPLYLGLLYLTLLPSTVQSSIAFTSIAGGNVPAAICAASLSNILGVVVTPLLVGVMFSVSGEAGFSLDAVEKILLQLLAPFVLGQLAQPFVGDWIRSHKPLVTQVDRGSILLVVFSAFSASVVEGLWAQVSLLQLGLLLGFSSVLLAFVMALTTWAARRAGMSTEDEIAIVFCGSKKSLASGVPIASALFPAAQAGFIILPVMIFHQIQLLVCASLANRYARQIAARDEAGPKG